MGQIYKMTTDPRRGLKGEIPTVLFNKSFKGSKKNTEALNLDIPQSGMKLYKGELTVQPEK